jgi:hypothetical protein
MNRTRLKTTNVILLKRDKQQGKAGHYSSNVGRVAASN